MCIVQCNRNVVERFKIIKPRISGKTLRAYITKP
nr:MAG TPA: hypothetical protein [Caudoviricetes sp.]